MNIDSVPFVPDGSGSLAQGAERIWSCKIGGNIVLPDGSDWPMRQAVQEAFLKLAGVDNKFCFSGWGGDLTEGERAVVENRLPAEVEANNDEVICPGCCHQFRAIPVNVQEQNRDLLNLVKGFHRKLAIYKGIFKDDKELSRLLAECESAIARATAPSTRLPEPQKQNGTGTGLEEPGRG